MIIHRLHLKNFGHFRDQLIEFSGDKGGFHLVYGPNEAGKSTTLQAVTDFLFGIPHVSAFNFLDNGDLSISASLATDTATMNLTRYKRRKNDLLDEQGKPVDQRVLNALLAETSKEVFQQMFSIDHQSLRTGGEEILKAGGNLGEALFSAASGISHLRETLARLEDRQGRLFKPRGTSTRIFKNISEVNHLKKDLREKTVSSTEWKKAKKELDLLDRLLTENREKSERLAAQSSLLERQDKALTLLPKLDAVQKKLEDLKDVPVLDEDFRGRRIELVKDLEVARQEQSRLQSELEDQEKERSGFVLNTRTLDETERIESVAGEIQVHKTGLSDARGLEHGIRSLEDRIRDKLASLDMDQKAMDRLTRAGVSSRLHSLISEHASLHSALQSAVMVVKKSRSRSDQLTQSLEELPPFRETSTLSSLLEMIQSEGDPARMLQDARHEMDRAEKDLNEALSRITNYEGDMEILKSLVLPSEKTLALFRTGFAELNDHERKIRERQSEIRERRSEKEADLARLQTSARILPELDDLKKTRSLRDHGWSLIKSQLAGPAPSQEEREDFIEKVGQNDLITSFEETMTRADQVADVLREEADRVAQVVELRSEIHRFSTQESYYIQVLEETAHKRDKLTKEWLALWQDVPLASGPADPEDMELWMTSVRQVIKLERNAGACRDAWASISDKIQRYRDQLGQTLKQLGHELDSGDLDRFSLVKVRTFLTRLEQDNTRRESLSRQLESHTLDHEACLVELEAAEERYAGWQGEWEAALTDLSIGDALSPKEVALLLDELDEAHELQRQVMEKTKRIKAIRSNFESYSDRVSGLTRELGLETGELDTFECAARMKRLLDEEQDKRKKVENLDDRISRNQARLKILSAEVNRLDKELNTLCSQAFCSDPSLLPEVEKQSQTKASLQKEMTGLEERLSEYAGGMKLDDFLDQVRQRNVDEIQARLSSLEHESSALILEREELGEKRGMFLKTLREMDRETEAAAINESIQGLVEKTRDDVDQYVRLHLASVILRHEIERYREKNQGPVLAKAGRLFNSLTLGSFDRLETDFDDKGDPVLRAVRKDGTRLSVNQMSDGSCDQLYLSLRLGGLYRYLENNTPLPFIIDDILVHFDDHRSASALQVLSDLSLKTQVIFFTHHAHLLDLARDNVEGLQVHRLGS